MADGNFEGMFHEKATRCKGLRPELPNQLLDLLVAEAASDMIVDHANRLTKCIDDGGTTEFEAARLEVL